MSLSDAKPQVENDNSPLGRYRVLDLSDERGAVCGRILSSLGADVIQVEPPEGCVTRQLTPFYNDVPDIEGSLAWWALGAGKRSICLDLKGEEGRAQFRALVKTADFLVESFKPGYMAEIGLSFEELQRINPRLILVSITPYGQTGPHSGWAASDLNIQGMGGHMYLTGDVDRSPVRVGIPASYWHGGSEAAAAALVAHHYRKRTGKGQHVDVSMQQCIIWTLLNTTMTWQLVARQEMRGGAVRKERGNTVFTRVVWPCKDGLVYFVPIGGGGGKSRSQSYMRFVTWMRDEGHDSEVLTAKDWNHHDMFNFGQEEYDQVAEVIGRFLTTKTTKEIYDVSVERRLLLAPVATIAEIMDDRQLREREFFVEVDHPELRRTFSYPGAFAKFSESPLRPPTRAPHLGEHSKEILAEVRGIVR